MAKCQYTLDEVIVQINKWAKENLQDPREKRFFDAWFMGSLFRQDGALKTIENRINAEVRDGSLKKRNVAIVRGNLEQQLLTGRITEEQFEQSMKELLQAADTAKWLEDAKKAEMQKEKDQYFRTNFQTLAFGLDIVDPNSVKEFGKVYNDIVQATTKAELTENDVRDILRRARVDEAPDLDEVLPGSSTLNDAPRVEKFSDTLMERLFDIRSDADRAGIFEGPRGEENRQLVLDLREIIRKNPHMRTNFSEFFAAVTARINEQRGGIGVTPTRASRDDVKRFINWMKDADRGDGMKNTIHDSGVPWWAYAVFPEHMANIHDKFDSRKRRRLINMVSEKGPVTVEVKESVSRMRVVMEFMQDASESSDSARSIITEELSEDFRFMNALFGSDTQRFFQSVVAKMEWDAHSGPWEGSERKKELYKSEWERHRKDYEEFTSKEYVGSLPGQERRRLRGQEVADMIQVRIEEVTNRFFDTWIKNKEMEDKVFSFRDGEMDLDTTMQNFFELYRRKREYPNIGLDGLYRMLYERRVHQKMEFIANRDNVTDPASLRRIRDAIREKDPFRSIGRYKFGYWPHLNHARSAVKEHLKAELEELTRQGASDEEKSLVAAKIRRNFGQGTLKEDDLIDEMRDIVNHVGGITEDQFERGPLNIRPGNTLGRSPNPIPQWDKQLGALEKYGQKLSSAYYKMAGGLLSDVAIRSFEADEPVIDTRSWARYMRMYVSRSMGYPSVFPKEYLEDKRLNLFKKPYWYFTDQALEEGWRAVDNRFFKGRMQQRLLTKEQGDPGSHRFQRLASWWSNVEGKYELMTLLASPKSFINNFAQVQNTAISAGLSPTIKANSVRWLKNNLLNEDGSPMFSSKEDIYKFVGEHAGVESYVVDNFAIRGRLDTAQVRAWIKESTTYLKDQFRQGKLGVDADLLDIARKHNITENTVAAAGWFMRESERRIRANAFMAHYIRQREILEANGFILKADDPWLIELARRGTQATQFMYNAAFRPAFASSATGKIFSRFQLWAWNSVRFQNDVRKQAKLFNYKEGTPEFDRFRRMMALDVVWFGLAALFPMSFFESTLPQPLGWLNDLVQYMFDDDEERRKNAFFGALPYPLNPLGAVLPPASRLITNWLTPLITGDWERFASYYWWTWFPFGNMARQGYRAIENPIRGPEAITGFPLTALHRYVKNTQKGTTPDFLPFEFDGPTEDELKKNKGETAVAASP